MEQSNTNRPQLPPPKVAIGLDTVTVNAPVGARVYLYEHTDATHSILTDYPKHGTLPVVLYTDRERHANDINSTAKVQF